MCHTATIAGDWTALVQRLHGDATLTRWGVSEPALAGIARLAEIVAALSRGGDPDRAGGLVGGPAGGGSGCPRRRRCRCC